MSNGIWNKAKLTQSLASRADLTRAEAKRVVDTLFDPEAGIIAEALRGGESVSITGFGSFEAKRREARKGRNPRTGKEVDISASTSAAFRAGKGLKESLGR